MDDLLLDLPRMALERVPANLGLFSFIFTLLSLVLGNYIFFSADREEIGNSCDMLIDLVCRLNSFSCQTRSTPVLRPMLIFICRSSTQFS